MRADFIYRQHEVHQVKWYVPTEGTFLIRMKLRRRDEADAHKQQLLC